MAKLTKRLVDRVEVRQDDYFVWDADVKGLGLRVWPSGKKTFVFKYRLGGRVGVSERVTIGDYPTFTPDQARKVATRLRGEVAAGKSPAAERKRRKQEIGAERAAATVEQLANEFLADRKAKKKASTVAEYDRLLKRDVLPELGKLKVTAVTRPQIAKLHNGMSDRPYLANRAARRPRSHVQVC